VGFPRTHSKFVPSALNEKLPVRGLDLVEACRIINGDPEVRAIEKEFDDTSSFQKHG